MLLAPMPTFAASATFLGPIVPQACHCDNQTVQGATDGSQVNSAPDWGCVLQVIQNLVNFGVTLAMTLFTIYLVITGFSFITSAGSSEARSKAKTRFANVFIGLAIMLCAWLIVDFVMKQLYNPDATVSGVSGNTKFGPWNAILAGAPGSECIRPTKPAKIETGVLTTIATSSGTNGASTGTGVSISGGSGSTKLNTSAASSYAINNALSKSSNQCALYVRKALAAGGLTSLNSNHPGYAYQYTGTLTSLGFNQIYSGTYSSSLEGNIPGLQVGDVVVFQPVAGHSAGHIALYTSSGWVSDYRQNTMSSNPKDYNGGTFAIFRP